MNQPRRRTAATALVACTALALAACSGKAAPSADTGSSGSPTASAALLTTTPHAKGPIDEVTWNLWEGEPYTTDPFHSADYKENTVNSNMCETLLAIHRGDRVTTCAKRVA